MSDALIQAEGLGKRYIIGHQAQRERYTALRDVLARGARTFLRKASDLAHGRAVIEGDELEEVWALRDVSFDVKRGEVLGIIGRNGAGKSTLLKILSRITEPTAGRVLLRGRVASLLEVGTGFHPELSGRENIFLNGAILGMSRAEIRGRFDEIVAFAEVERFLDTPVKRYSSGMYVRLAFAVAAHLEPDILIVDEVLAVGDAQFQRKCLGKMRDVSTGGRTVIFVSHNVDALHRICQTGLVLSYGRVVARGDISSAIGQYLRESQSNTMALRSGHFGITGAQVSATELKAGRLRLSISFNHHSLIGDPTLGMVIYDERNHPILGSNTLFSPPRSKLAPSTGGTVTVFVDPLPLWSGSYRVSLWLSDGVSPLDHAESVLQFDFVAPHVPPNVPPTALIGATRVNAEWEFEHS